MSAERRMHFLMFYECSPDYLTRRGEFRAEHLRLAWAASDRGELVLAGAYGDRADGAVLLFKCESVAVLEAFAAADPYVRNGLVTKYSIRPWTTVVGDSAASSIRL
jgi:uncharacterized protein YciI